MKNNLYKLYDFYVAKNTTSNISSSEDVQMSNVVHDKRADDDDEDD